MERCRRFTLDKSIWIWPNVVNMLKDFSIIFLGKEMYLKRPSKGVFKCGSIHIHYLICKVIFNFLIMWALLGFCEEMHITNDEKGIVNVLKFTYGGKCFANCIL